MNSLNSSTSDQRSSKQLPVLQSTAPILNKSTTSTTPKPMSKSNHEVNLPNSIHTTNPMTNKSEIDEKCTESSTMMGDNGDKNTINELKAMINKLNEQLHLKENRIIELERDKDKLVSVLNQQFSGNWVSSIIYYVILFS